MNFLNLNIENISEQIISILLKYKDILIYIKGSPDPDVIASSFALAALGEIHKNNIYIYSQTKVSLPQNERMILNLEIPIHFDPVPPPSTNFDAYIVLDHQSAFVKDFTGKIPCAIHFDHHIPEDENLEPELKVINDKIGSISTLMALIYKQMEINFSKQLMTQISTSLLYGIRTDTNNLSIGTKLDEEAIKYLSKFYDKNLLMEIARTPYSQVTVQLLNRAAKNQEIYKNWLISHIAPINEKFRDNIAIIADYLLSINKNLDTVIIFTLVKKNKPKGLHLDASFRSRNKKLDLNEVIKAIADNGGGRLFKGAFQVNLDFFADSPFEKKLWNIVKQTSILKIKKIRDHLENEEGNKFFKKMNKGFKKLIKFLLKNNR